MSAKDFAQTLIDAYSILRLNVSENRQSVTYGDADHGRTVYLFQDKSAHIDVIATASQQAKNSIKANLACWVARPSAG